MGHKIHLAHTPNVQPLLFHLLIYLVSLFLKTLGDQRSNPSQLE